MKLLTAQQMQALEKQAIEGVGLPSIVLMENASRALAKVVLRYYPVGSFPRIIALAGKGNNGGDAIAAARILAGHGYRVSLFLLTDPEALKPDPAWQLEIYKRLNLPYEIVLKTDRLKQMLSDTASESGRTLLLDGLFGVGLQRPVLDGFWAEAIVLINEFSGPVLAVDLPSGCGEFPEDAVACRVQADITVTFQEPKVALIDPPGRRCAGQVEVVDIGIPSSLYKDRTDLITWIERSMVHPFLLPRDGFVHKNNLGHGLAVVGSAQKPGAGMLAVRAAMRSGIGLCSAVVSRELRDLYISSCPESMVIFSDDPSWLDHLEQFPVILLGPGLGTAEAERKTVLHLMTHYKGILVVDGDGLNILAQAFPGQAPKSILPTLVMTPHVGEMARLLNWEKKQVEQDRIASVRLLAQRYAATVVLKGRYSLIANDGDSLFVNPTGNPGMATAGSGDVLSGILLALITQYHLQFELERIVCAGVWLHGRAGDLAAKELGQASLKAGDLIDYLPQAFLQGTHARIQI